MQFSGFSYLHREEIGKVGRLVMDEKEVEVASRRKLCDIAMTGSTI